MPTDKIPQMRFIADVTVGEGEAIPPNTRFVKTWRVENSGNLFCYYYLISIFMNYYFKVMNHGQVIVHYVLLMVIDYKIEMKFMLVH
jgi:hypothetical protein